MADESYGPKVYREQGGDKIVCASGGTVLVESGGVVTMADGALEAPDMALASAKILVGDGDGEAAAVSLSGDATIDNAGALTIANTSVETAMLAANAVTPAKTSTGVARGAQASYIKTANGVQTALLAASAAGETRVVMVHVLVDEVFADGDGAQPTFKIGETDTDDKFAAASEFTGASAGAVLTYAGVLTAAKALIVTATTGTGTTFTGGITVTVTAVAQE